MPEIWIKLTLRGRMIQVNEPLLNGKEKIPAECID